MQREKTKPKFCPNCGVKLVAQRKFCSECGFSLKAVFKPEVTEEPLTEEPLTEPQEEVEIDYNELGNKLEMVVEKIFSERGFKTERRKRVESVSGTMMEMDIVAEKGDKVYVIECKNYAVPVGVDKMHEFVQRLEELKIRCNGLFVTNSRFTDDAAKVAEHNGVETWDRDEAKERFWMVNIGRAKTVEDKTLAINNALPLCVNYDSAVNTGLQNQNLLTVSSAELVFHPYAVVTYALKGETHDPVHKLHRFTDEGSLYLDALSGEILNLYDPGLLKGITRTFKDKLSTAVHIESERVKKQLLELRQPAQNYNLGYDRKYRITVLPPGITQRQATWATVEHVKRVNQQDVSYARKDGTKGLITYIPKPNEITILRNEFVLVPRWIINFDSLRRNYVREIMACTGTSLEDTLRNCPLHFKLGSLIKGEKRTVAVCEVCGQALCEDHITKCVTCGKWLCKEHAIICSACGQAYCKEHCNLPCPICGKPVCPACIVTCPDCGKAYGKNHTVTCNNCEKSLCSACTTTSGLIFKKRLCKNCSH